MTTFAVIDAGKVVNTIEIEREAIPLDIEAVEVKESDIVSIGYSYQAGVFTAPAEQAIPQEQLIAQADLTRSSLMQMAAMKIAVLQDAVDLNMALDDEKAQLTAWKQYRVLLNRIDTAAAPTITWPDQPA